MKTQESEIAIRIGGSMQLGSCNACNRYSYEWGIKPHRVYDVELKNIAFRLCPNCKDDLIAKLKKLEP